MAPASSDDWQTFRSELLARRTAEERARMDELSSSERYRRGDLEVEAQYYRLHFRPVLRPEHLDAVVGRLRSEATTCDDVLRARAIEQRLYEETWISPGYDLVPKLREIDARTLVLHGEHDFVSIAAASRVADAIPGARFAVMRSGGHFAFVEAPDDVYANMAALFDGT
jgi:pimeloyl-ACP methyl ester carboxylesterase